MSNELELPLTEDGTGYEKESVEQLVAVERDRSARVLEQAEAILVSAQQQGAETVAAAEARKQELLDEADALVAERTAGLDTIREDKLAELEDYVASATEESAKRREDAERDSVEKVSNAEKVAERTLRDAERKASNIIEEAMSKVHALVKTAHGKLEAAKADAEAIRQDGLTEYAEATARIGSLIAAAEAHASQEIADAQEEAEQHRLDAETTLIYAKEESRLMRESAQNESDRIFGEATKYRLEVAKLTETELAAARESIEAYKTFYNDNVSRLTALWTSNLEISNQLAAVEFPDGSNVTGDPAYAAYAAGEEPAGEDVVEDVPVDVDDAPEAIEDVPADVYEEAVVATDSSDDFEDSASAEEEAEDLGQFLDDIEALEGEELSGTIVLDDEDEDNNSTILLDDEEEEEVKR